MLHVILFVTLVINHGLDQKTRNLRNVINDYERAERASRDSFRFYIKIIQFLIHIFLLVTLIVSL